MAPRQANRSPQFENSIGGVFFVLILVTLLLQASARILGVTIPITEEFARYQLFTLTFIAMSGAIVADTHQSIDVLRFVVGPSAQQAARLVVRVLMVVLLTILLWLGVRYLLTQIASERQWFSAPIPQWIAYACYPIGCAMGLFRLIEKIMFQLRHWGED